VTLRDDRRRLLEGCVTVGNRVRAAWQQYNYFLGTGTIVGFERETETGWIKAVIDFDYPRDLSMSDDGYCRWDWDRVILCTGHWEGETQEQSVARWRESLAVRQAKNKTALSGG